MTDDRARPAGADEPGPSRAMDRMWAGWRSTYVAAAGNGALAGEGSIFRRILDSGL